MDNAGFPNLYDTAAHRPIIKLTVSVFDNKFV